MDIIREYVQNGGRVACVIRANVYTSTLSHFMKLFEEAKRDFPDLEAGDVEVKHYAGERYSRTFGIEFSRPVGTIIPNAYFRRESLERSF